MKSTKTKKPVTKKATKKVVAAKKVVTPKKVVVKGISLSKEIYFSYALQVIMAYTALLLILLSYYLPELGSAALSVVIISILTGAFNYFSVKKDYFMTLIYILFACLFAILLALGAI